MRLIPTQIWKEEFTYYSEKSVAGLKTEIQQLLNNTKREDFSVNLMGEFTSDFEFEMTPKWQVAIYKGLERKESYLNGKIFRDEFKRTCVTFTVRPNLALLIFFFLLPVFGILTLTSNNIKGDIYEARIMGLFLTFGGPLLMLLSGYFAKRGIKNNFIKAFNLKPIE